MLTLASAYIDRADDFDWFTMGRQLSDQRGEHRPQCEDADPIYGRLEANRLACYGVAMPVGSGAAIRAALFARNWISLMEETKDE